MATRGSYHRGMGTPRRLVGRGFLGLVWIVRRAWRKSFSVLAAGGFAEFGRGSVLEPPVRLENQGRISIGRDVFVGPGCCLQTLDEGDDGGAIEIGDGVNIAGSCVISAASRIRLGRSVLLARNVYIADHRHAFEDPTRPVLDQGVADLRPVEIGDGAWLGQNVVVCPGVRIGRGAVVGANAVVTEDVPDYAVAVGVPARVVREFGLVAEPAL
jgi:acetyltransferase-like isoleucine patch superfamily enzyme